MAKAWHSQIGMKGRVYYDWPKGWCENKLRLSENREVQDVLYDVAIIGAGVVGCALAYHLSQYRLKILLLDKNHDVGEGTSKANSAIIHTGFDAIPGTLESRLVTRASRMWPGVAEELKIPLQQSSAMVLALTVEEEALLPKLLKKSIQNGVDDVRLVSGDEAKKLEPNISEAVKGALCINRESIIDPFTTSVAFAEVAVINGVNLILGLTVTSIVNTERSVKCLYCNGGREFKARTVVNAAGLGSTTIGKSYGAKPLDINPRRGQFLVYDKTASSSVSRILLPVPNPKTKGILIAPTIFGNIIAGPTAEDLPFDRSSTPETTPEGIALIKSGAARLYPRILNEPPISAYAGLRCHCQQGQYQITYNDGLEGVVTLTGIRSTGLTVSVALAEAVREGLENECGLDCKPDENTIHGRHESARPGWVVPRPFEDDDKLCENPDYAHMICFCVLISRQEVINAIHSPLSPRSIDAIRRRTRSACGRCQGFYCLIKIAELICESTGTKLNHITKKGPGSEIFIDSINR